MNCTFCKIMNNELPSYTIYEDEVVKVFLSIDPINNGHTLIVPKNHYLDINDIPVDVLSHVNKISKKIATLLKEKLNYTGLKIVQNNGFLQEVKHYHLHVIPFFNKENKEDIKKIYEILKK